MGCFRGFLCFNAVIYSKYIYCDLICEQKIDLVCYTYNMESMIEKISLSAFGAFIGIIAASVFTSNGVVSFQVVVPTTIIFLILAIWHRWLPWMGMIFRWGASILGYRRVAIINLIEWANGIDSKETNRSWTNVEPTAWKKAIYDAATNKKKLVCKKVSHLFWLHSYHVVVNPYGGVYYEKDFETRDTLNWFLGYMARGGVLVNVADVPFYYAYDKKIERSRDAGIPIYSPVNGERKIVFDEVPFIKALGLKVVGTQEKMYGHGYVLERVVKMGGGINNLYEPFNDVTDEANKGYSPFVRAKYDKGAAIISMLNLNDNKEQVNVIAKKIILEID